MGKILRVKHIEKYCIFAKSDHVEINALESISKQELLDFHLYISDEAFLKLKNCKQNHLQFFFWKRYKVIPVQPCWDKDPQFFLHACS